MNKPAYEPRDTTRSQDARKQSQHRKAQRKFDTRIYIASLKGA